MLSDLVIEASHGLSVFHDLRLVDNRQHLEIIIENSTGATLDAWEIIVHSSRAILSAFGADCEALADGVFRLTGDGLGAGLADHTEASFRVIMQ